jgi:leucyl/phenylalanyl-tRNA--protein transferase
LPDLEHLPPELNGQDLVGLGGDLEPGTLLTAYRTGLFPMHVWLAEGGESAQTEIGWWSPDPRGVLPLGQLVVSRSLRQSCRRLTTTVDVDFAAVIAGCAETRTDGQWINHDIRQAYQRLHELGWAHSIETWHGSELVGGLYGIGIGGLFAGESMFHRVRDASKVALVRLVGELASDGLARLLDVQWVTPHLASLGAVEITRDEYRRRLDAALSQPEPPAFRHVGSRPRPHL